MFKVAFVLACLASAGCAEPLHTKESTDSVKNLAALLLASDPSAAFNPVLTNARPAALQSGNGISPQMKAVPCYDLEGKPTGAEEDLSIKVARAGPYVVHRKFVAEMSNIRESSAHVKTRAEVRGGGRKPYPQKGTGNARRGSNRSPLIVGGGKSFGPRNKKNYYKKVNIKEGKIAVSTCLMGAIPRMKIIPEEFHKIFEEKAKTKDMRQFLQKMGIADPNVEKTLIISKDIPINTWYAAKAMGNKVMRCKVLMPKRLTVRHVLWAQHVLVTESGLKSMRKIFTTIGKSHRPGEEFERGWQDKPPAA